MKKNLWLVAGSLCFALLLCEGALRIAGVAYNGSFFQGDTQRGWALRPNAEGWLIGETKNYRRINSDGLHDREHALAKPPHTLRIAVLGDSCTEGAEQPIAKVFVSVLGQQLAHCSALGSKQVEVINFGVSGYGTAQELLTLRSQVWKYNPDIVLLAFYAGNDVFNNHRDLNPSSGADQCPYFVFRNDRLVLDDSFRHAPDLRKSAMWWQALRAQIVNHSRVVQLIYSALNAYRQRAAGKHLSAKASEVQLPDMDDQIYWPTKPKVKEAWRVTEALLSTMNREVRTHGAEFWIVSLWTSQQVSPNPGTRQQFCHKLGLANLSYPDLRIQALATKEQIPLILLAPAVAAYTEEHNVFVNGGVLLPPGTGHFNELGHRLAGNLIASELCSRSPLFAGSASANTPQAAIVRPAPTNSSTTSLH
jgi:lysophospholipase L1-like esterase